MKMTTTWNRILLAGILWCGLTLNSFSYAADEGVKNAVATGQLPVAGIVNSGFELNSDW
ncbi:MAG: hypothetical protein PHT33_13580 [bacterium]|nr:hypothetical protein [bacterium]